MDPGKPTPASSIRWRATGANVIFPHPSGPPLGQVLFTVALFPPLLHQLDQFMRCDAAAPFLLPPRALILFPALVGAGIPVSLNHGSSSALSFPPATFTTPSRAPPSRSYSGTQVGKLFRTPLPRVRVGERPPVFPNPPGHAGTTHTPPPFALVVLSVALDLKLGGIGRLCFFERIRGYSRGRGAISNSRSIFILCFGTPT